jgi:hypothetical protein
MVLDDPQEQFGTLRFDYDVTARDIWLAAWEWHLRARVLVALGFVAWQVAALSLDGARSALLTKVLTGFALLWLCLISVGGWFRARSHVRAHGEGGVVPTRLEASPTRLTNTLPRTTTSVVWDDLAVMRTTPRHLFLAGPGAEFGMIPNAKMPPEFREVLRTRAVSERTRGRLNAALRRRYLLIALLIVAGLALVLIDPGGSSPCGENQDTVRVSRDSRFVTCVDRQQASSGPTDIAPTKKAGV